MSATPKLRAIAAMILNALDRDAAEGKPVRGEMARELREVLAEQAQAPCPLCDTNEVVELRTKHCLKCDADFAGADEMSANKAAVLAARAKRIEPAPAQDEQEFNTSDGDLTELLNIAADMVKGVGGGMDLGIYFVTVLERVEERLAARPAQTEQPGQSEELAWKVLQAATDALDRRAAPHAWISQAWNAGSEVITSRRPVAGGRDE